MRSRKKTGSSHNVSYLYLRGKGNVKGKAVPVKGKWRSAGFCNIETVTLSRLPPHPPDVCVPQIEYHYSRQRACRWWWGCQPCILTAVWPQVHSWHSLLLEAEPTPGQ
jgi:hypothetical protein